MSKELGPVELAEAVDGVKAAFEAFKETNDARLAEMEAKGAADPLLAEKVERIESELTASQEKLDAAILAAKRAERVVVDEKGQPVDLDAKAQEWAKQHRIEGADSFDAKKLNAYETQFKHYLRKGDRAMNGDEFKALSVGSDPDGGYTVHADMSGRIAAKIFDTSPMRAYASVQTIGTDALEGLYDDDEASASWVAETAARTETDTPELGSWRIPVHELYANPMATQKLLDDSAFNAEQWLADKVALKMGRVESTAFVTGDGVGKPRGFTTYDAGTSIRAQVEQVNAGASGAFVAAPNSADVLIDALYKLKAQYRANASWFMNRNTMAEVRKLKDSNGYVWIPSIAAGQPATLLGHPVAAAFEDMADIAANSLSIAVGDMASAYQIVERQGTRVLRDPYSNKPYVGFYTVRRCGGALVNGEAIKLIKFAS